MMEASPKIWGNNLKTEENMSITNAKKQEKQERPQESFQLMNTPNLSNIYS